MDEPEILKYFEYSHLPPHLQPVSQQFQQTAQFIVNNCAPGAERSVSLRKLLESKDAAVRAAL